MIFFKNWNFVWNDIVSSTSKIAKVQGPVVRNVDKNVDIDLSTG